MANLKKNVQQALSTGVEFISTTLGISRGVIGSEAQEGGGFLLFSIDSIPNAISDEKVRALIYQGMSELLKEIDVKWMVVALDSKGSVVDELDSLVGY